MNIQLENLTLKQLLDVERCVYNTDFEFTDSQFREYIAAQIETNEIEQVELELQEEVVYIYDSITFFYDLIQKGECIER